MPSVVDEGAGNCLVTTHASSSPTNEKFTRDRAGITTILSLRPYTEGKGERRRTDDNDTNQALRTPHLSLSVLRFGRKCGHRPGWHSGKAADSPSRESAHALPTILQGEKVHYINKQHWTTITIKQRSTKLRWLTWRLRRW